MATVAWQPSSNSIGSPADVVVSTPERVSFGYETAGLGTRFLAQAIDLLILGGTLSALGTLVVLGDGALAASLPRSSSELLAAGEVIVLLILGVGYFPVSEALWSGKTVGKLALRLRVVDARGGPVGVAQVLVRNIMRLVDFLPIGYAVGVVVMFVSGHSQRLGDLAAGTLVVRERQAVGLAQLVWTSQQAVQAQGAVAAAESTPAGQARWARRLDPALKRFVVAYTARRYQLHPTRRAELAGAAGTALSRALPEVVAARGPLAALEQLADEEMGG